MVPLQMFERETKREKILEARQREIRLKDRSRSQQSREDEAAQDDGRDSPHQLIARAEREFYSAVEAELRRTNQVLTQLAVSLAQQTGRPVSFSSSLFSSGDKRVRDKESKTRRPPSSRRCPPS